MDEASGHPRDEARRDAFPPRRTPRRGDPTSRTGGIRRALVLVGSLLALMLVAGALSAVLSNHSNNEVSQQELATRSLTAPGRSNRELPASLAAMMGLQRVRRSAPGFRLVDQQGRRVDLGRLLRHHVVVLTFMDDMCKDICPLVAREIVDAHHDLGPAAARVDFVAVNVNAAHSSPAALRSFIATSGHGIGAVPSFDYVTGTPAALRRIWARYGISVKVTQTGAVYHSEAMYFIAPGGAMRYLATPYANLRPNGTGWLPVSTVTRWGEGIARYAKAALG